MDLVSIIVPVYNVEQWLPRCVDSLIAQTYKNLEIILVDDGSTNNSGKICDEYAEKDDRIVVIHKENGGLSSARNAGFEVAKGNYISFVDSDDWVMPQFIEKLYNAIIENDCDLAECGFAAVSSEVIPETNRNDSFSVVDDCQAMKTHLEDGHFRQVVWNKLYKREIITVEFAEGKYHEDVFWTYQIIANCKKLVHITDVLYCYFQREGSIMGASYSLKRLDGLEATQKRTEFICAKYPSLAGHAQAQLIGTCMFHSQQLLSNKAVDPEGIYSKQIHSIAKACDVDWKRQGDLSSKQKLWMRLYLLMPNITCWVRNLLKIGV
ncbi:MAG: glycosyltransferase [Clostridia bacterium]|nr:glycosyltransferase [Clostridia bacterium]